MGISRWRAASVTVKSSGAGGFSAGNASGSYALLESPGGMAGGDYCSEKPRQAKMADRLMIGIVVFMV
jgi:hypothetical protein